MIDVQVHLAKFKGKALLDDSFLPSQSNPSMLRQLQTRKTSSKQNTLAFESRGSAQIIVSSGTYKTIYIYMYVCVRM